MKNYRISSFCSLLAVIIALSSCGRKSPDPVASVLTDSLDSLVSAASGSVGVAVITSDGDTVTAGEAAGYPLMSVFKLHEALAVADVLDKQGMTLDTTLFISRSDVSPNTWSPMLKDYPEGDLELSVGQLMGYMLIHSDNNASNILFDRIVSVAATDSIIRRWNVPESFSLAYTERQMQADHDLSYLNNSSPLSCAVLIYKVFNDSLVSPEKQAAIRQWLSECRSAENRIAAAVGDVSGAKLYHRTGSGYTNDRGEIVAVNDVAYIELPDGRSLAVAILTKDFPGSQDDADAQIAAICRKILSIVCPA